MVLSKTGLLVCMAAIVFGIGVTVSAADDRAGTTTQPSRVRSKLPDPPGQTRPAGPAACVYVGVNILRITNLDIPNNKFSLDFWIWFRWTDDSLKPYESFELANGKIDSSQVERVEKIDGINYACLRVQATMSCFWNVARFPLCKQTLSLEIEDDDLEADQLVYVSDKDDSHIEKNCHVAGWVIDGLTCDSRPHTYATNYGDPRNPTGKETYFYRQTFSIQLRRADVFHSFKIFSGLYLAALVAFTVFFVKPDHRLGLIVGAIFAVVASHTVISSYLPEAGVLTLADKLHLVTAGVILIALFETSYSLHLLHKNREASYRRLDRFTFCILAPVFLAANIWLLMQ